MSSKEAEPLLPRIAAGDSDAIQRFVDRYKSLIWWLARKHASTDAEDAVQEIFIDLWKSAERFDASKASEPTFVGMIARRRLIDRARKRQRRPQPVALDDATISQLPQSVGLTMVLTVKPLCSNAPASSGLAWWHSAQPVARGLVPAWADFRQSAVRPGGISA